MKLLADRTWEAFGAARKTAWRLQQEADESSYRYWAWHSSAQLGLLHATHEDLRTLMLVPPDTHAMMCSPLDPHPDAHQQGFTLRDTTRKPDTTTVGHRPHALKP